MGDRGLIVCVRACECVRAWVRVRVVFKGVCVCVGARARVCGVWVRAPLPVFNGQCVMRRKCIP
jgi:hypothetical protein